MEEEIFSQCFKQKLLSTFKAFIAFCEENDLRYYVVGGTAIGAIRHHGMIPWDDDIDVSMPYSDYLKLISIHNKLDSTQYGLHTIEDAGYYLAFSKFYDKTTSVQEFKELPFIMGVYVDIFPVIDSSMSYEELVHYQEGCWKYWQKVYRGGYHWSGGDFFNCIRKRRLGVLLHRVVDTIWYRPMASYYKNRVRKIEKKCSGKGKYCCSPWGFYGEKEVSETEWLSESVSMPFEDFNVEVPIGYHQYLNNIYGDYMQLPPLEQRVNNHGHFYVNLKEHLSLNEVERRVKNGENMVY